MVEPEELRPFSRGLDQSCRQLLIDLRDSSPAEDLSIDEARHRMHDGQSAVLNRPNLKVDEFACAGYIVHCVRSRASAGALPAVFFLHGGGWVMGDMQTHAYLVAELAERSGCAIVFVDYPLSPEVTFPTSLEAASIIVNTMLVEGDRHEIDPKRFAFAGDSAGGNLATCLVLHFQQSGLSMPRAQVLLYPALDARANSTSYQSYAAGLNLTAKTMRWFWQQYCNSGEDSENPLYSPALADGAMLQAMPDTLIITSEFDVLRDEGEEYARRLREAGVNVCSIRVGGMLHGFMVTEMLAKSYSGDLAIQITADYLRRQLGDTGSSTLAPAMPCDTYDAS